MRIPSCFWPALWAAAGFVALAAGAQAETRGVSDTEIVIGTVTDLSGVTAIQGVNNSDVIRMVFDAANAKGGVHGRKIRYIVEDSQYQVPRAVQAMNKLLNRDSVFMALSDGGTPMNNANLPAQLDKGVPNVFPLTAARSMYEPFNRLKFGQFASYYDELRAGVKYFVEKKGKKSICAMTQDTDFGRDVLAGATEQAKAMGLSIVAETAHKPTDIDFNAAVLKLRDAKCDLIVMGTIVKDTTLIVSTARKMGWNVDFLGQFASYDPAVAEVPGGATEGFYSMTPALFVYPDDPKPGVKEFAQAFKERFGRDINFHGEMGYTAAHVVLLALERAGKDLTLDGFIKGMESIKNYKDMFGMPPITLGPDKHQGTNQSYLAVVHDGRWVAVEPEPLGY